jgi:hypothetical protein
MRVWIASPRARVKAPQISTFSWRLSYVDVKYVPNMSRDVVPPATATTAIEVDTLLLERLRARHPGKADREIIEDVAQGELGFSMLRQAKERNVLSDARCVSR